MKVENNKYFDDMTIYTIEIPTKDQNTLEVRNKAESVT